MKAVRYVVIKKFGEESKIRAWIQTDLPLQCELSAPCDGVSTLCEPI
jgi:hypothetical protein